MILSDSLSALQALKGELDSALANESTYYLNMFSSRGVEMAFGWIPSHVGIRGNEVGNWLTKSALSHSEVNFKVVPGFKALVVVAKKVMLEKWQTRWNNDVKDWFFFAIEPQVSFQVKYSDNIQRKQTAISRLRFDKCLLNDVLGLFGRHESGFYDLCGVREDVKHFLMKLVREVMAKEMVVSVKMLLGNKCV